MNSNKIVKESLIKESPDFVPRDLLYNRFGEPYNDDDDDNMLLFDDYDAHPFWVEYGELNVGRAGASHPSHVIRTSQNLSGRFWYDRKVISFWNYPDAETFKWMMNQLSAILTSIYNKNTNILKDPGWKVEVIEQNKINPWKKSSRSTKDAYASKMIHPSEYAGSSNRSEDDLATQHVASPLFKKKRYLPGWGSSSKKYRNNRVWQMAAPIGESKNK